MKASEMFNALPLGVKYKCLVKDYSRLNAYTTELEKKLKSTKGTHEEIRNALQGISKRGHKRAFIYVEFLKYLIENNYVTINTNDTPTQLGIKFELMHGVK